MIKKKNMGNIHLIFTTKVIFPHFSSLSSKIDCGITVSESFASFSGDLKTALV